MAEYRRGSHTVDNLQYLGHQLWARGYLWVSVGEAMWEQIREYIEKHQEEVPVGPRHTGFSRWSLSRP